MELNKLFGIASLLYCKLNSYMDYPHMTYNNCSEELSAYDALRFFSPVVEVIRTRQQTFNPTLTTVNLQKMGMSGIEISRLVKLVNGWGKGNGNFANGFDVSGVNRINLLQP